MCVFANHGVIPGISITFAKQDADTYAFLLDFPADTSGMCAVRNMQVRLMFHSFRLMRHVKDPCRSTESAGGRLKINTQLDTTK